MNLKILKPENADFEEFIEFWSQKYDTGHEREKLYADHISKEQFTELDIIQLYDWKNGSTLSGKKLRSLSGKILSKIDDINRYKLEENYSEIEHFENFAEVSAVWNIFLLHIISHKKYPIYDQHIHRAYNFLHSEPDFKVDNNLSDKEKLIFYTDKLLPFLKAQQGSLCIKIIDQALFEFGKFLKNERYASIFRKLE